MTMEEEVENLTRPKQRWHEKLKCNLQDKGRLKITGKKTQEIQNVS